MRRIAVDEAVAGEVLAEPLTNANGQVLLPKGAKLSAAVLSRFRGWGVEFLSVEGEDETAADVDERLAELEFRFSEHADDTLMQQIKAIAREHLRKA